MIVIGIIAILVLICFACWKGGGPTDGSGGAGYTGALTGSDGGGCGGDGCA